MIKIYAALLSIQQAQINFNKILNFYTKASENVVCKKVWTAMTLINPNDVNNTQNYLGD